MVILWFGLLDVYYALLKEGERNTDSWCDFGVQWKMVALMTKSIRINPTPNQRGLSHI